ncbi:bifunctional aminoglycoside phosphotransferase/ATP-binding protein [Aidingimonas lacisalsi]|uniref:bifunctional aminoglycoside phosphotransferase/ATP-binding protein n=1 Tax=Aidingimonas lacisalsi TaxID=2604086 RepID=UPI0011D24733|nr:bifunctional aminoglycoside phosphotransferase/ATP-binding protein [Aidingimonas lacisalsi]
MSSELLQALQDPQCYDHSVDGFALYETHISWVLLTGEYVYKIKKPVDFGFLNFSTLDRRKRFCEEEIRLNKRLASALYVDVVPVTGTPDAPRMGGEGEPFEYAIRMRQFDNTQMMDRLYEEGRLTEAHLDELAGQLADFHESLPSARGECGTPGAVRADAEQNFEQIRPLLDDQAQVEQLDRLSAWNDKAFKQLESHIARRYEEDHVRECHGDLHLANITLYNGQPTVFDCIEFSDGLRWIDTCNDLAFLLMDLEFRDAPQLANRVLNRYLQLSGDYDCLPLMDYYKAYRATVRAKIALFTRGNPGLSDDEKQALLEKYQAYINLAEQYAEQRNRYLLATTGLSGSGKSWVSQHLSQSLNLIWLRSDVERKRLFGLKPLDSSHAQPELNIYTSEASRETYQHLATLAENVLKAGYPVIVDSAALHQSERAQLVRVAAAQDLPYLLLNCQAPESELRQRLERRGKTEVDPSEADEAVMEKQQSAAESLSAEESDYSLDVDTTKSGIDTELADQVRERVAATPVPA